MTTTSDPLDDVERYLALSPERRDFVDFLLDLDDDVRPRVEEIILGIRRHYGGRLPAEHIAGLPKLFRGAGLA